ncbi:hypothetical protein WJX73_010073 [Symbiochloris irregularis]|uniref:Uncharacterized protein n=1 Tax=Symbiochloris irregularis TaxID=706552 RepID=A0AAW1PEU9_9CHLO
MASSLCFADLIIRSHCCAHRESRRQQPRPCRCLAATREPEPLQVHGPSASARRRDLLASISLLLASCSAPRWCHAQKQATAEPEASTSGQDNVYETTDFYMKIPARYQQAFDAPVPPERLGRGQAQPQTPLKARFLSDVKGAQITIVARESFQIKPTFFQCQDISQLGSVDQLSSVLLPPGAKLLSASSQEV